MAKTPKLETAAFTIEEGQLTKHASGSRTQFRFAAPSQKHLDGGFEVDVYITLFDAQNRFVHRRSGERSKLVLGTRAAWVHEIDNDVLTNAVTAVYEINHRFDIRRKISAGELLPLPPEADGSDYVRWQGLDPRTLEDRIVRLDLAFWARNSYFEITYAQHPKVPTDSCRTELELDLLDADKNLVAQRNFSASLNCARPDYNDTSISMDRKTMRTLRFFELRGRTECRSIATLTVDNLPAVTETP
jgi:hypothetical protein